MESQSLERRRPLSLPLIAIALAAFGLIPGCVGMGLLSLSGDCPPVGVPCQIAATWSSQVGWTADSVHGGDLLPGLGGRIYLFGPDVSFPMAGDGGAVVELYDETPVASGGEPVMLEVWNFDPDTLKRLLKRDPIGWGYTLFLPWKTYNPAIAKVLLKARYVPLKGWPLYAEHVSLTLCHDKNPRPVLSGSSQTPLHAMVQPGQAGPGKSLPGGPMLGQALPTNAGPVISSIPMPAQPMPGR